jgi:hypothetical protein
LIGCAKGHPVSRNGADRIALFGSGGGSAQQFRDFFQVVDETLILLMAGLFIGRTKDGRRMDGGHHPGKGRIQQFAAVPCDAKFASEQRLRGGGPEADDHLGLQHLDFGFKPRTASRDFHGVGLFVDAPLAAGFPLEVLYRIRDVDFAAIDARFDKSAIEQLSGRADERLALKIFLVAGLFADENDFGALSTGAEDRLSGVDIKIAGGAGFGGFGELLERGAFRNERKLKRRLPTLGHARIGCRRERERRTRISSEPLLTAYRPREKIV